MKEWVNISTTRVVPCHDDYWSYWWNRLRKKYGCGHAQKMRHCGDRR